MSSASRNPGLALLGSLRLTVTLLGMSIFLVFAGTLAQRFQGNWSAVDQYFRCWIAVIDMKIFLFADSTTGIRLPYPGGKLLGAILVANLLVSHAMRIRVQATGQRLLVGSLTLAIGAALTWYVIAHVFDADSTQKISNPSGRVTMQLIQGGGAAAVLYVGCWLLFRRKAGIVLIHFGVVILMISELVTGMMAEEGNMTIAEGQKVNWVEDTRKVELAVVDASAPDSDDVFAVPERLLRRSDPIRVDGLPIVLAPLEGKFMKNAVLQQAKPGDPNPATQGAGTSILAKEASEASGVDMEGGVDLPAVYVKVTERDGGRDLGTFLASIQLTMVKGPQIVRAGGKDYRISLRFKRTYKPYYVYLSKFRHDVYAGTDTAKDFSSFVRVEDPERGVVRDVRIWMNNPLRYRGDTLYQSSWDRATEKGTVLQVVDNAGWMAPYVACMIVAVGLLGQFQLHLLEFLRKRMTGGAP
ncbi:MAG: cytochrome c biogenesis protein ResB [Planctomycetes bacterium]|nr:cytochrome c biogenesis protein ResB [Planctomycetota bacterium]